MYLRGYSLAYQFAGYLEERASRGDKVYAFKEWQSLYTADFLDALNRGWSFKDLEDAIDLIQRTKHQSLCVTPWRLLENDESVMKMVYLMRRKSNTLRQTLNDSYDSWYLKNEV